MDTELERFKTEIDLRQFAQSLGFAPNARESWRGSAVMERGQQDKIIITRDSDNHSIFWLRSSVRRPPRKRSPM